MQAYERKRMNRGHARHCKKNALIIASMLTVCIAILGQIMISNINLFLAPFYFLFGFILFMILEFLYIIYDD
jgi:hypothetical protein